MTTLALGAAQVVPHVVRRREESQLRSAFTSKRALVLTYDDGPGPSLTPRLLDVLSEWDASATFFLLGKRVAGNPGLVDRIASAGHEIGCHGYEHLNAWKVWPWRTLHDVREGYRCLTRWTRSDARYRPPYGKLSPANWLEIRRRHATFGWWSIDSGDTHPVPPNPQRIADQLARVGGAVVLMHDFDRETEPTERATFVLRTTELLLETAQREGITVCRYSDLTSLHLKKPTHATVHHRSRPQ